MNVICHNLLLSNEQYKALLNIVENNKNILNSSYVLKINRVASYFTFILKEIYDYVNLTTGNGVLVQTLKRYKNELLKSREKLNKITKLLNK